MRVAALCSRVPRERPMSGISTLVRCRGAVASGLPRAPRRPPRHRPSRHRVAPLGVVGGAVLGVTYGQRHLGALGDGEIPRGKRFAIARDVDRCRVAAGPVRAQRRLSALESRPDGITYVGSLDGSKSVAIRRSGELPTRRRRSWPPLQARLSDDPTCGPINRRGSERSAALPAAAGPPPRSWCGGGQPVRVELEHVVGLGAEPPFAARGSAAALEAFARAVERVLGLRV
jgi:hypothetical protein